MNGEAESEQLYCAWGSRIGDDGETLAEVHARASAWLAQPRDREITIVVTRKLVESGAWARVPAARGRSVRASRMP